MSSHDLARVIQTILVGGLSIAGVMAFAYTLAVNFTTWMDVSITLAQQ